MCQLALHSSFMESFIIIYLAIQVLISRKLMNFWTNEEQENGKEKMLLIYNGLYSFRSKTSKWFSWLTVFTYMWFLIESPQEVGDGGSLWCTRLTDQHHGTFDSHHQIQDPCCSHGIQGGNQNFVEFFLRGVFIFWDKLSPGDPFFLLQVKEVFVQCGVCDWQLTWNHERYKRFWWKATIKQA